MRYILLTLICLPLAVTAQRIEKTFTNIKSVNLTTGSADIDIRKAGGNQVTVVLEHSFGDEYEPSIDQRGERLVIKDGKNRGWSGDQKYTLTVPDDIQVNFTTGSGDISVDNLLIELKGTTGSGDMNFTNLSGSISLNTGSGDMKVDVFNGELTLNVGSGDTEISGYKGDLSINCGSGDIEADGIEGIVRINAGSGSIELEDANFTGRSALNAGSGDIDVVLASSLKSDLAINTGSGDATLDMDGNSFDGTVIMEADKRQGKIEASFDFDKTEEIEENNRIKVRKTAVLGDSDVKLNMSTGSGVVTAKN